MDRLLIIADDFTGALDTGIQFTKMGIRGKIITDYKYDFDQLEDSCPLLVVNTDSRPLSPEEAYQRVYNLSIRAKAAGFEYVYKKTDSGLRGNIGMELKAVMDAYEEKTAYFIPALPNLNRITRDGIQYIDGVPVKDSVFGQDPFEPVRYSDVAEIIHSQIEVPVTKIRTESQNLVASSEEEQTIFLFDATTNEELHQIANTLKENTAYHVCAGCAGFATTYGELLAFPKEDANHMQMTDGLLGLCGSVNAITVHQLEYAGQHGFTRENLCNEQKLNLEYLGSQEGQAYLDELYNKITTTDQYLLDTLDVAGREGVEEYAKKMQLSSHDVRLRIADTLGIIAAEMVKRGLNYTISMTGGDTLMGFMRYTDTTELVPICEIGKGAVMSSMTWMGKSIQVISKSGGFGEEDIFLQMHRTISNNN